MLAKYFAFTCLVLLVVYQSTAQITNPSCVYIWTGTTYICFMTINNPTGHDNFTIITGQHMPGLGNSDVQHVIIDFQSVTSNVPRIICDTFRNTRFMAFDNAEVEEVGSNAFSNCTVLANLQLQNNRINRIAANAFVNNPQLEWLDLNHNLIIELPANIFSTLTRLSEIRLRGNRIDAVSSNWFGFLSNVIVLTIEDNGITAIDRRIMEALPNVLLVDMTGNVCANGLINIADLTKCFDNYDELMNITTTTVSSLPTTTPGQCIIGDINQEVCSLRSDINALENRVRILERIVAGSAEETNILKELVQQMLKV